MNRRMIANYHTHTYRCNHAGKFSDAEYVEQAIANGFQVIGFSDHTPWPYTTGYVSRIRMVPDELPGYLESIKNLKEEYDGKIKILTGMECEYFPEYMGWLEYLHDVTDYLIFGPHWYPTDETGEVYFGKTTTVEQLQTYFQSVVAAMKTGLYTYIAHPDFVLSQYPQFDTVCEEGFHALCETAKEMNMPLEFNVSGYQKRYNKLQTGIGFPNDEFWKIAQEVGCTAIIGLDAHNPATFGVKDDIVRAETTLKDLGISVIQTLPI